ncbi:MAG: GNAT family N-acetyltransferase [Nanoarchaeota archaeon]|nr:GNAT family N-acetyltransferase [Nanoarchaeota archaeon]
MRIRKATEQDKKQAIKIAEELKEWFTRTAIKNMKIDFDLNSLIVIIDKNKVFGFLCYTSYSGRMQLIWMGVKRSVQRKGLGDKLLKWLEREAKKLGLHLIEVETLPDEDDYEPYKQTRAFYYKNGFKRILYRKSRTKGEDDQIVLEKKL